MGLEIEFEKVGAFRVRLNGGPHDGECFLLSADGSQAPPAQMAYFGTDGDTVGWFVYETVEPGGFTGWPAADEIMDMPMNYIGFKAML